MSKREILTEDAISALVSGDGFGRLMQRVLSDLQKFGEILSSAAKLLVVDVNRLIVALFGKTKSFKEYKQARLQWDNKRKVQLSNITSKANDLAASSLDGQMLSLMLAPQSVLSSAVTAKMLWPFTADATQTYAELGFDELPLLGTTLFSTEGTETSWMSGWGDLLNGEGEGNENDPPTSGLVTRIALNGSSKPLVDTINDIFVKNVQTESVKMSKYQKSILLEAAKEKKNPFLQVPEKYQEELMKGLCEYLEYQWPVDRDALISDYQEPFEKHLSNIVPIIEKLTVLSTCKTFKEFKTALKPLSKLTKIDFDLTKIENGFKDMRKKLLEDEKSIQALEEEGLQVRAVLKEDKEKLDVKQERAKIEARLDEVVLNNFKGVFMQKMREELQDFYESLKKDIYANTTEEQRKLLQNSNEYGKKIVTLMEQNINKINSAMQKLSNI